MEIVCPQPLGRKEESRVIPGFWFCIRIEGDAFKEAREFQKGRASKEDWDLPLDMLSLHAWGKVQWACLELGLGTRSTFGIYWGQEEQEPWRRSQGSKESLCVQ